MSRKLLETIRVENGRPQHLFYHQQRMDNSLEQLGYSCHYDLASLIKPPDKKMYRCRIIYDAESFTIDYIPYQKRTIRKLQLVQADELDYTLKYADRRPLDVLFMRKGDADDILIVKNDLVTDTSIANIAFFDGQRWLTPKHPLLKGTTRARLLDEKKIFESEIHLHDLDKFSHFALLNAMIGFEEIKNGIIAPLKS
ncbi:aminotransferase class IV family protein [Sulfurimonas sp. HSL3-7]|uniref:aminotransferase class IV family protein n=1 Tax=Sulfonitrofixus jiaomeiensis TaxID=3131938 RepID=UPI0031FA07AD